VENREASSNRSRREGGWKRERFVAIGQEGRANGKERGLRGITAGSVELAACPIHIPGEVVPREIKIRISLKNHAPQMVPPDSSQARSLIFDALANYNVNVSSV
jgi:hypothetical protein